MESETQDAQRLDAASIAFDGDVLTVQTGAMTRVWQWTGRGFLTTSVALDNTRPWRLDAPELRDADWLLPVCEDRNPKAELVAARTEVSDDEGFTSKHVAFMAEMLYPEAAVALRFIVWAFPNAPGIRVNLQIRALDGYKWDGSLHRQGTSVEALRRARLERGYVRHDCLPLESEGTQRRVFGYFSDTQNRNDTHLDILLEAVDERPLTHPYTCEWANAICVEDGAWGVALLKESHGCVNQHGHDTGAFLCLPGRGIETHGWGILPHEIDDQWRPAWPTWCLAYEADDRSRQKAFKQFDRLRYPAGPRDVYIQANTWGSSQGWLEHREAAGQPNVLREIDSCADLGIDVLQIDDGWQGNDYETWTPIPERYPEGWTPIREHAARKGVKMGLWMPAMPPSLDDMAHNAVNGGFVSLKLDFAVLNNRRDIDKLISKVRAFVKRQDHAVRVNWDLTEVTPRYGFYFAREFGCIYLENRKPVLPRSTTYRPGTVLRDLWQISRYCNLLKFQGSVQNIDRVDPLYSDAGAYSHAYCVDITLMISPLFFCETHFYDDAARAQIRPLLKAYKNVREKIAEGVIYPIGEKPNGTQWTGFECGLPDERGGFLTIFREPWNTESRGKFSLPHLAEAELTLEDLLTSENWKTTVDTEGDVTFQLDEPGSFLFLSYQVGSK